MPRGEQTGAEVRPFTNKEADVLELWKQVTQRVIRCMRGNFKFVLLAALAQIENPRVLANSEVDRDQLDRWASLYPKDLEEFRGSLALWDEYRAWCQQAGEHPTTKPAFLSELKKRESRKWPWLRKGRTPVKRGGESVNGYWGLKT